MLENAFASKDIGHSQIITRNEPTTDAVAEQNLRPIWGLTATTNGDDNDDNDNDDNDNNIHYTIALSLLAFGLKKRHTVHQTKDGQNFQICLCFQRVNSIANYYE